MIASKTSRRTSLMVLLAATPLTAVPVIAYTYTWTGNTNSSWTGYDNWTRAGCGSPCNEYPDGTDDDAVIPDGNTFPGYSITIDDLSISDSDVRFGGTGGGYCEALHVYTFDSITVSASSGETAVLRGGNCVDVITD